MILWMEGKGEEERKNPILNPELEFLEQNKFHCLQNIRDIVGEEVSERALSWESGELGSNWEPAICLLYDLRQTIGFLTHLLWPNITPHASVHIE